MSGLVEGANPCNDSQQPLCVVSLSLAGGTTLPTGTYSRFFGTGFQVTGSTITSADWTGIKIRDPLPGCQERCFNGTYGQLSFNINADFSGGARNGAYLEDINAVTKVTGFPVFSSKSTSSGTASVPGPLPALGAAVAFRFSRKLRQRIKAL